MTKPLPRDAIYRRRAFDAETIEPCVRWYIAYRLSYAKRTSGIHPVDGGHLGWQ